MAILGNNSDVQLKISTKADTKAIDETDKKLDKLGNIGGKVAGAAKVAAAGLVVVGAAVVGAGSYALKAASQFETMNVALETAFQGNVAAAKAAGDQITQFAARTPYELDEVMRGFIKLKNMGLDPSQKALTSYGDTASAMGKSLNDMVEAVADAATGEFERLKEFGIRASSQGDRVKFTFQGVTTEVGKNSKEIEDYLIKLGQTKFAGGMEAQSKTLTGMLANLSDSVALTATKFATEIGLIDGAKWVLKGVADGIDDLSAKTLGLFDVLVKGDFTKRFADAFGGVEEDSGLANGLLTIRENLIAFGEKAAEVGKQIFDFLWPSLKELGDTIINDLVPAVQRFWKEFGPILVPILETVGKILGGAVLLAIKNTIDQLNFMIDATVWLIDRLIDFKNGVTAAFDWVVQKAVWLKDNFWEVVGFVISYFALLPVKLPFLIAGAIAKVVDVIRNVNWGAIWLSLEVAFINVMNSLWFAFEGLHKKLTRMDWGAILVNIGKGIGNAVIGLIEGAVKGATAGIPVLGDFGKNFKIPRFEFGTSFAPGGWAMVGERGPELVNLPRGSQVVPNKQTEQIMARQGTSITVNHYGDIRSDVDMKAALRSWGWQASIAG